MDDLRELERRVVALENMLAFVLQALGGKPVTGFLRHGEPMPICGCIGPCANVNCPHRMEVTSHA